MLQNLLLTESFIETFVDKDFRTSPTISHVRSFARRPDHSETLERAGADEANGPAKVMIAAAELMEELCIVEVEGAEVAFFGS